MGKGKKKKSNGVVDVVDVAGFQRVVCLPLYILNVASKITIVINKLKGKGTKKNDTTFENAAVEGVARRHVAPKTPL